MSRQGMRGRLMNSTNGTAAKKKRRATSVNGGNSRKPTLIGTNEKPHSVTTASVNRRSRGASAVFTRLEPPLGEAPFERLARGCRASQLDDAPRAQRFA